MLSVIKAGSGINLWVLFSSPVQITERDIDLKG